MPTDPLPLEGVTLLNLRAAEDAAALTGPLQALGAAVIEQPAIAFADPSDRWASFDARADRLHPGEWIAFTSATALRWTLRRFDQLRRDRELLRSMRIAAIGRGTARALTEAGLPVHVVPKEQFQAEGLLEALLHALEPGESVWLPRAEQGREVLVEGLERTGHPVCVTPVYRTIAAGGELDRASHALKQGRVDWVVFTSSAVVTYFLDGLAPDGRAGLCNVRIACLGQATAQTAAARGLRVAVLPSRQDLAGLVEAIVVAQSSAPKER